MKILIACEESQEVCKAFRKLGHEAYSCDLLDCSGGHPEWHLKGDAILISGCWKEVIYADECIYEDWDEDCECAICPVCKIEYVDCMCPGPTQDDIYEYTEINGILYARLIDRKKWDMMIAFPPCTDLALSGSRWFKEKIKDGRQQKSIKFFMDLVNADIDKIAIENPIGIMSTHYRKPDQIINPYDFNDPARKPTCLWLKNLPKLVSTNMGDAPLFDQYLDKGDFHTTRGGKMLPKWYNLPPSKDRGKLRSKTFPGIAKAMAEQWGNYPDIKK